MSYSLEGRELHGDSLTGVCIFCGQPSTHANEGGTGWIVGSLVNGEARAYLYCNTACPPLQIQDNYDDIWRCGCVPDYVENVGNRCHVCKRLRECRLPVDGDDETARPYEKGGVHAPTTQTQ